MSEHPAPAAPPEGRLPPTTRAYLCDPSLSPVWDTVRDRLENAGLSVAAAATVDLDETAAARLNGLFGVAGPRLRPGRRRVQLARLDEALRSSAAQRGLVSVVAELTGSPLVDRRAGRAADRQARSDRAAGLDGALARAGLAGAGWVGPFTEAIRRSGLLTRAGDAAPRVLDEVGASLRRLNLAGLDPADSVGGVGAEGPLELGELATWATGDAHGLDEGRVTPLVVLRAAAAALGMETPTSAAERRALWALLGVSPDQVSGTVLTWGLRPVGYTPWAVSMRTRADLGLVTHLTLQELVAIGVVADPTDRGGAPVRVLAPGEQVWACENPQVVQAAARARARGPLVCTAGNPSGAGWRFLSALVAGGVEVAYHGDFDWPGIAIADRLFRLGVRPWRMASVDYEVAVAAATATQALTLSGKPRPTPWDERLAVAMRRHETAIHEEALTEMLLADLRPTAGASDQGAN